MGHVYAVSFSDGTCKVGRSWRSASGRIKNHEQTKRKTGAVKTGQLISIYHENEVETENELISMMKSKFKNSDEYSREWFLCEISDVYDLFEKLSYSQIKKEINLFINKNHYQQEIKDVFLKTERDAHGFYLCRKWVRVLIGGDECSELDIIKLSIGIMEAYRTDNALCYLEMDDLFTITMINKGISAVESMIENKQKISVN